MLTRSAWLIAAALAATVGSLAWKRLLAYLRYFQQEGYAAARFLRWVHVRSLGDPAVWLGAVCVWLAGSMPLAAALVFVGFGVALARVQPDPRRSGKIPLRLTWRATRVLGVSLLFAAGVWTFVFNGLSAGGVSAALAATIVVLVVAPLILLGANTALTPYEYLVQQRYEADAASAVRRLRPFIIGITGSYGKSSTKAMLAHILQFKAPTLAASGSINTIMGVTRHIRERLMPGHRFMVVEMGAFKTGSIRRLCHLTPPSAAIITAVGDMHLERFGSLDAIVDAKGELAEALPSDGLLVVNADSPGALAIARRAAGRRVLLYGETSTEDLATRLEGLRFSKAGSHFTLRTPDAARACWTPLLGRPIVLNLAGAFTLASALGVDPEVMVAAFRTLTPVSNRLEVVDERGITWIKDAYNSNQFGFRAALEVAAALPATRRFLATPGVIELGAAQLAVNRALSREAASVCDSTVVVSTANREAFILGHRDAGREARLVTVPGRREAFAWLAAHAAEGDVVILENDLPDLYEQAGMFW